MKKLRTQNQLQDFLDAELSWRIKEIADMKSAVKRSKSISEKTIIRAATALLYAHWEGFVKKATTGYVAYVNNQGSTYFELQSCFVALGLKKILNDLAQSRTSTVNIAAIDFIRDQLGKTARLKIDSAINTESNLSSTVFENILLTIGIDPSPYQLKYHLIDKSLLERRNNIAHGEYLDIHGDDWANLTDEVLLMLRWLKTDIENASTLAAFRRQSQSV